MRNATRRPPGAGGLGATRGGSSISFDLAQDARTSRTDLRGDLGTAEDSSRTLAHHRRSDARRGANAPRSPVSPADYAARMDLTYPPEAEEFRAEIRAWL